MIRFAAKDTPVIIYTSRTFGIKSPSATPEALMWKMPVTSVVQTKLRGSVSLHSAGNCSAAERDDNYTQGSAMYGAGRHQPTNNYCPEGLGGQELALGC